MCMLYVIPKFPSEIDVLFPMGRELLKGIVIYKGHLSVGFLELGDLQRCVTISII